MNVLKRMVRLLIAFPVAVLLITLAVANRHTARLVLDPFRPDRPALALEMPFYFFIFGALLLGVLLGGWATWLGQGSWRSQARQRAQDAKRWEAEAGRLIRERDAQVSAASSAPKPLAVVRR